MNVILMSLFSEEPSPDVVYIPGYEGTLIAVGNFWVQNKKLYYYNVAMTAPSSDCYNI